MICMAVGVLESVLVVQVLAVREDEFGGAPDRVVLEGASECDHGLLINARGPKTFEKPIGWQSWATGVGRRCQRNG